MSSGATLKSPHTASSSAGSQDASIQSPSRSSQASLAAKNSLPTTRPFGTYRLTTRTPPQVAATKRPPSSVQPSGEGPRPAVTASMPTRDAIATPFQRPRPWWTIW
jgi:hypothetical protein